MIEHHPTPNPDSLKFTCSTGPFIDSGMLIVSNQGEAEADPLGKTLFSIEGVINVFALPEFLTVTKHPDARWNRLLPAIRSALADHMGL